MQLAAIRFRIAFVWRVILLCSLGSIYLLAGCKKAKFDVYAEQRQKQVIERSEQLNKCYLEGDFLHARTCLKDNVKLLEEGTILEPIGRSELLLLVHLRLHVMEKRAGDEAAAEADQ
jgi:hypothetical protein